MSVFSRSGSFLLRALKAEQGTVLVAFTIMLLPLLAITGGLIDYGRVLRAKSQLSATIDAAVLAAQLQYSSDDTIDYEQVINDYVAKNMTEAGKTAMVKDVTVGDIAISEDGELSARVRASVDTHFLRLVGIDEMSLSVEAAARVGGSAVEVALVLDNTGSMQGEKIKALKNAATDLVNAIMLKPDDEKIKFALLPFADYVNIGIDNRNEEGLDIPAAYQVAKSWTDDRRHVGNNCQTIEHTYDCGRDHRHVQCTWTEYVNCSQDSNPDFNRRYSWNDNYDWYGCMGSRPHDLNVRDEDYGTQGVPGIMATSDNCSHINPVTRLTSKRADILSGINQMKSEGWTYIPSGLSWGWRALSPEAPFADGVSYDNDGVQKVIVLMTDGANTRSIQQISGDSVANHAGAAINDHGGTDVAGANQMTSELCTNIKAKGIMLYTISFDVAGDEGIQSLLRSCAGNGGQYYNADNSTELADAFRHIGLALLNLRLSR